MSELAKFLRLTESLLEDARDRAYRAGMLKGYSVALSIQEIAEDHLDEHSAKEVNEEILKLQKEILGENH